MGKRNAERGATAIEYGLMISLGALLVIASATSFGSSLLAMFAPVAPLFVGSP